MNTKQKYTAEHKRLVRDLAIRSTLEWFDELIEAHKCGAVELERRKERFLEVCNAEQTSETPVNVVSWAVNDCQNVQRNLRLDMAANHAAALITAEKME